ncbi:alpha/beta hydrolase fold domain-containing protein [Mycolicibacterium brisbanense]|nr:alpha/beta hydrolase fold domain-containing protein [Mycolicibacterium brisbanense]
MRRPVVSSVPVRLQPSSPPTFTKSTLSVTPAGCCCQPRLGRNSAIACSEPDLLRDEALDCARRLPAAGVSTELHVFAGTCHGFDSLLPHWETSRDLHTMQGVAPTRGRS